MSTARSSVPENFLPQRFSPNQPLKPYHVYCAAIGIFEKRKLILNNIILDPDSGDEKARIYRREQDNKLFIIYYPAKDSDDRSSPEEPLAVLNKYVGDELTNLYSQDELKNAHKFFIVCERSKYLFNLLKVTYPHYVLADVTVDREGNEVLTVEDSYNLPWYSKDYITRNIPNHHSHVIYRDWQRLSDNWQGGHYVISAISRVVNRIKDPKKITINDHTVAANRKLYALGNAKVRIEHKNFKDTRNQNEPASIIDVIPDVEFDTPTPVKAQPGFFTQYPLAKYALVLPAFVEGCKAVPGMIKSTFNFLFSKKSETEKPEMNIVQPKVIPEDMPPQMKVDPVNDIQGSQADIDVDTDPVTKVDTPSKQKVITTETLVNVKLPVTLGKKTKLGDDGSDHGCRLFARHITDLKLDIEKIQEFIEENLDFFLAPFEQKIQFSEWIYSRHKHDPSRMFMVILEKNLVEKKQSHSYEKAIKALEEDKIQPLIDLLRNNKKVRALFNKLINYCRAESSTPMKEWREVLMDNHRRARSTYSLA